MLRVRIDEGNAPQPTLLWDSVWQPPEGVADWALADPDETQNLGGLRSKAALHSAVVLSLFTDKRIAEDHPLRYLVASDDPLGWWDMAATFAPISMKLNWDRCSGCSSDRS
jgi:phage gp46-like protein